MQRPTCSGLRVRSPADAQVIFHAVSLNILPMVSRRLDTDERRAISSGCVFVWEERGPNAEATGLGIERWTDGIRWGPSRVRDEFLFYHEKDAAPTEDIASDSDSSQSHAGPSHSRGLLRDNLIKQTYSVFVDTPRGRRKWHLIAYFTQDSIDYLRSIDDIPQLANLPVPPGNYKSARSAKGRPREPQVQDPQPPTYNPHAPHPPYAAYPSASPPASFDAKHTWPERPSYTQESPRFSNRAQPRLFNSSKVSDILAPLAYLQNISPPRRDPIDEKVLMSFSSSMP
jgi:hypothetical protein